MIISITTLVVAAILVVFLCIQNKKLDTKHKQSTLALKLEREYPGSGKPVSLEDLPVGLSFKAVGQVTDDEDPFFRYHVLRSSSESDTVPEVITLRIEINEQRLLFKHKNAPPDVFSVFNHAPNKFDTLETIINGGKMCLLVTHAVVKTVEKCPQLPRTRHRLNGRQVILAA